MLVEVFVDALCHLDANGRVEEIGCADFYGAGACQEELYGIFGIADAAKAYDGYLDGTCHLVNHSQCHWLDGRTAQSARPDT